MDRVVPGGVALDLGADGAREHARRCSMRSGGVSRSWSSSTTTPPRCRTAPPRPAFCAPELARQFGAGGYVGRASGRAFDARKTPGYPPYDQLEFEVPVLDAGRRQCPRLGAHPRGRAKPRLIEQILRRSAGRADPSRRSARRAGRRAKAWAWSKASAATCSSGCGIDGRPHRALPSARSVLVPVAAAGGRRSKATSSPTSRSATNRSTAPIRGTIFRIADMRKILFESLLRTAAHRSAARRRTMRRWPSLPRRVDRAARRRLGRSLSIREVDAGSCNGCELEIHALNNAFYDLERFGLRFVASPRHADVLLVTGPVTKNMREALRAHLQCDARSQMGGRGRRLRARRRHLCRQLRGGRRRSRASCRSTCTSAAARRVRRSCSPVCSPCWTLCKMRRYDREQLCSGTVVLTARGPVLERSHARNLGDDAGRTMIAIVGAILLAAVLLYAIVQWSRRRAEQGVTPEEKRLRANLACTEQKRNTEWGRPELPPSRPIARRRPLQACQTQQLRASCDPRGRATVQARTTSCASIWVCAASRVSRRERML